MEFLIEGIMMETLSTLKKRVFRLSLGLAFVAPMVLLACAGGGGMAEDQKDLQRRDAEKLSGQYESLRGTYEGTLANAKSGLRPTAGKLSLYIVPVKDDSGVNPDGTPKFRPTLRGRFRLNDAVSETDTLTLIGDYDERSGALQLTTVGSGGQSAESAMLSIRGSAVGGKVKLELVRRGGTWGYFDGSRTSQDASAPAAGEDTETRQRLLTVYQKVVGRYSGVVDSFDGERYEIELNLFVVERAAPSGQGQGSSMMPALQAQYRRTDVTSGIGEKSLVVEYNSLTGEIYMTADTGKAQTGGGATAPAGSGTFSVTGDLINKVMTVTLSDRRGVFATVRATSR
jgi:hypothetical protein